jgi:Glu-tRNA(Gln) amidotransferase subunit E-like FAD-binding protein
MSDTNTKRGYETWNKANRDDEICKLYKGSDKKPGETLENLAKQFNLSRERVRQIVKAAGLTRLDRNVDDSPLFLGISTTAEVKAALRAVAKKQNVSVSSLSTSAIIHMLVETFGYKREDLSKKAVEQLVNG